MIDFGDIRTYLPKYLSPETEQKLFADLRDFPRNIDARMYGFIGIDEGIVYQGDGLSDLLVVNLPSREFRRLPSMVISNTCDVDLANARKFTSNMLYSPIVSIRKYRDLLVSKQLYSNDAIVDHLAQIRAQGVVQVFYLPQGQYLSEESIVFLDHIVSCDNRAIPRDNLRRMRVFSLSQYGLYLLLYKLSIFLTRLHEKVNRSY